MEGNKKTTLLENYKLQKDYAVEYMKKNRPTTQQVWYFQELAYRITVLEVFQAFLLAAPLSVDSTELVPHYQSFEAYVLCLLNERKFATTDNEEIKKQQATASENLQLIFMSNKKKFSNYAPRTAEQYHGDVESFTNTILPAWIQYRNTLIDISTKEGK